MREITIRAAIENIDTATDFVNGILEEAGCPMRVQMQIAVALDEMLSNVARYAYAPEEGDVTISVDVMTDPLRACITLTDRGVPYNPLQKEDPDVTLSAEERQIGGLGIFIVKQTMDAVTYEYRNGCNVVSFTKRF